MMTAAERTTLAAISFPAKVIPLAGTASDADNANIRAAIAAIKASGQPGEIRMSGDFKIGHACDLTGIDPDTCADLKLTGRGYCRWYKGVAATTTGLTGGVDPEDDTAYPLLARSTDDGPGKRLVIRDIIFEGDLATTQKWLGDASRLIALANYDRVELIDVEGRWGSETAFHLAYCDQVRASRINLNRIAANGLDASNCADVAVTDSDFAWIIGDCCSVRLAESAASDLGQQRTFHFIDNRIFNCGGVKLLGARHAIIVGNNFRVPTNYAMFIGAEGGEGLRVSEDVLISSNNIIDLVTADEAGAAIDYNVGILISQFTYLPHNVIVRGNNMAQRTAGTDGLTWSADQAARHRRREPAVAARYAHRQRHVLRHDDDRRSVRRPGVGDAHRGAERPRPPHLRRRRKPHRRLFRGRLRAFAERRLGRRAGAVGGAGVGRRVPDRGRSVHRPRFARLSADAAGAQRRRPSWLDGNDPLLPLLARRRRDLARHRRGDPAGR